MRWILDINTSTCHLAFEVSGQHIWVVHQDFKTMVVSFVTQNLSIVVESLVKNQCIGTSWFIVLFCMFFKVPLKV
jgi:hypothetical protein